MEEDNDFFELFLQLMQRMETEDTDGRLRARSKEPRYAADEVKEQNTRKQSIER